MPLEMIFGIIAILLLLGLIIIIDDLAKRLCNSISYIEILRVQEKIDAAEAENLLKILRWQGK